MEQELLDSRMMEDLALDAHQTRKRFRDPIVTMEARHQQVVRIKRCECWRFGCCCCDACRWANHLEWRVFVWCLQLYKMLLNSNAGARKQGPTGVWETEAAEREGCPTSCQRGGEEEGTRGGDEEKAGETQAGGDGSAGDGEAEAADGREERPGTDCSTEVGKDYNKPIYHPADHIVCDLVCFTFLPGGENGLVVTCWQGELWSAISVWWAKIKLRCKSCSHYECKAFLYHRKCVITLNIPRGQQSASVTTYICDAVTISY